jgi:hypothetical protein
MEEEDPVYRTTVVYTIAANEGHFSVAGVEESDGVELTISDVRWDGEKLHFVSFFPPTKHKASHIFVVLGKGRARHTVSYSDENGEQIIGEVWKLRLPRS